MEPLPEWLQLAEPSGSDSLTRQLGKMAANWHPRFFLAPAETYERLEADKKKQVHKKRKCPGPIITYHSVTVPLVGELGPKEENVDVEG